MEIIKMQKMKNTVNLTWVKKQIDLSLVECIEDKLLTFEEAKTILNKILFKFEQENLPKTKKILIK